MYVAVSDATRSAFLAIEGRTGKIQWFKSMPFEEAESVDVAIGTGYVLVVVSVSLATPHVLQVNRFVGKVFFGQLFELSV